MGLEQASSWVTSLLQLPGLSEALVAHPGLAPLGLHPNFKAASYGTSQKSRLSSLSDVVAGPGRLGRPLPAPTTPTPCFPASVLSLSQLEYRGTMLWPLEAPVVLWWEPPPSVPSQDSL